MASVGAVALLQDCPLESTSLQARELIGKYVSITNDDESETHAINDLANILLEDPFNVDMLQYFSSVLVDIILDISSRSLQGRALGQWCVLAGQLAEHVLHTRGLIEEVFSIDALCIGQIIVDIADEERCNYLKSLRKLLIFGCLSDLSTLDIAALLDLILCHSLDNNSKITESVVVFQAASLFFEVIGGVSPLLQQEYLRGLVGNELYPQLLVTETDDGSTGRRYRARSTINAQMSITAAVDSVGTVSAPDTDERLYDTPGGMLSTVNICGVKFPLRNRSGSNSSCGLTSELIYTENTLKNIRKIAVAVAAELPILLQGTAGSGKSFLIREFAALLGQKESLVELHLDESTDSKSLIGNYTCSDVPGTFVWQPGLITQAVLKGHWLVIEDVDAAPAEIMAALVPLIERRMLYLPNRMEEVKAHPGFRIFGTRTIVSVGAPAAFGAGYNTDISTITSSVQPDAISSGRSFLSTWHVLQLSPLSNNEIKSIMQQAFPQLLPPVVDQLLSVYNCMCVSSIRSYAAKVAVPSALLNPSLALTVRGVLKIAKRIAARVKFNRESLFITERQNEDMLMEVLDVVVAKCRTDSSSSSVSSDATCRFMCEMVGSAWGGLTGDSVYHLWSNSNPQLNVHVMMNERHVSIGRVSMISTLSDQSVKDNMYKGSDEKSAGVFAHASQTLRLLEKIAGAVDSCEPTLLVGETGCGKTTCVQQLAQMMGKKLIVLNISLSTDVNELLGGFRPVTIRQMFMPSYETFLELFQETFSSAQNTAYLLAVSQIFKRQNWRKLLQSFKKAGIDASSKYSKLSSSESAVMAKKWSDFMKVVARYEVNLARIENGFAFAFVEGMLVDAMRKGHWVLLDEINLASPETLQGLTGILDGLSLCLTERGDVEPVVRDPAFRIFAAMNPPTDVGKRELSSSLRSRFTEIYVDEMLDEGDLTDVVMGYLSDVSAGNAERVASDVVSIYLRCRELSETVLVDTAGVRPRYSLRSLTRTLKTALNYLGIGIKPLNRALYEAFMLTFATLLDEEGKKSLANFFQSRLHVKADKNLSQPPTRPGGKSMTASQWVLVKPFWLRSGPLMPTDWAVDVESARSFLSSAVSSETDSLNVSAKKPTKRFVLTPSVDANIRCLAAAVAAGVAPVLLQGPTSVGKTSMIEYLAARTGHKCVRINNHEHTDVQEYIGGYITNDQGRLVFNDGLLVQALRCGHWMILDELNLAPSDVLEALNRLLDDNKELLIPETGELVHPAPGFALFATQNPPGIYGGRKPLSRAFRNRFIEIHIGDLPLKEIEDIVHKVCGIPKKFSALEVAVMNELQLMRQQSSLFQGKHGALTTRDLIKWGNRKPDSVLAVAIYGYMLLAEKLRSESEKNVIIDTLQSICKVKLDLTYLYKSRPEAGTLLAGSIPTCVDECNRLFGKCLQELDVVREQLSTGAVEVKGVTGVAPTLTVQRMWLLINQCVNHSEAVLLVGETGSGKTTVCQLLAAHRGQTAHIVNCHQSTETADIIGGLRPVRNRDGIFVNACKFVAKMFSLITENSDGDIEQFDMTHTYRLVSLMASAEAKAGVVALNDVSSYESVVQQTVGEDSLKLSMTEMKNFIDSANGSSDTAGDESPMKRVRVEHSTIVPHFVAQLCELLRKVTDCYKRYKALFEWQDGPLVIAMKQGDIFVLDEVNLADDAVLERLNSVLESGREITLAEKGGDDGVETEKIIAHPNFRFMGTMNPGGDFGKRELSPALRSRFTELWVPAVQDKNDLVMIVREMLAHNIPEELVEILAACIVDFAEWIDASASQMHLNTVKFSVREIVAWVKFISFWTSKARSKDERVDFNSSDNEHVFVAYVHGAQVLVLDGLGIGSSSITRGSVLELKDMATVRLIESCPQNVRAAIRKSLSIEKDDLRASDDASMELIDSDSHSELPFIQPEIADGIFKLGYFSIPCGNVDRVTESSSRSAYVLSARSTVLNMHRVLRALQLPRPILLEGAPGVGKTSLISSLAKLSGHNLVRINLSEHSEISDLLGTDLPKVKKFSDLDDGSGDIDQLAGQNDNSLSFAWCDGIFLSALKRGDWVLLDELNLAPQSVLEGLNACFDHRGEIYLPEIGMSFKCPPSFRVFCAQNPVMEGGGRKGLPQSFLSRFSRVFVDPMSPADMTAIAQTSFADLADVSGGKYLQSKIPDMIRTITQIQKDLDPLRTSVAEFGRMGSPWEFNLRDVIRWCELFAALSERIQEDTSTSSCDSFAEADFDYVLARSAHLLFTSRLRTAMDRSHMAKIYFEIFGKSLSIDLSPEVFMVTNASMTMVRIGTALCDVQRRPVHSVSNRPYKACGASSIEFNRLFGETAIILENIALCCSLKWPVLLIGSPGTGKRKAVRYLAELTGNHLVEFSMTSSVDASDILGSFEQSNMERKLRRILRRLERIVLKVCASVVFEKASVGHEVTDNAMNERSAVVLPMVTSWHFICSISKEVFQFDLIRLDRGKELLQLTEQLISALWESQELTLGDESIDAARKELLGIREDFMLFAVECNSIESASGFEWIDGILLEAMQLGRWLLFDNVNQCTPSVLDRLNSLLEPNGTILLTENGTGEIVRPHKNFRIFFAMDSTNGGEISRAMRNRCVECYCPLSRDVDILLTDIAASPFNGSQYASWRRNVLTRFVKSTLEDDDFSGTSNSQLSANWVGGLHKRSLFRTFKKFKIFLDIMECNFSPVSSGELIVSLAIELMGPLIQQRVAADYTRSLISNSLTEGSISVVQNASNLPTASFRIPVSFMSSIYLYKYLPATVTGCLQLLSVLAPLTDVFVSPVSDGANTRWELESAVFLSDVASPALLLACDNSARLSSSTRALQKFLSDVAEPSKDIMLAGDSRLHSNGLYFSAICHFIRICAYSASSNVILIIFELMKRPENAFFWRSDSHICQWTMTMISFLRHNVQDEKNRNVTELGSVVSGASVALRLPAESIADDDRARNCMGHDAALVPGSGTIASKRVMNTNDDRSACQFLRLADIFVISRLQINFEESAESLGLDSALMEHHSGRTGTRGMSLFAIGEAVDLNKITSSDSKQIYVISALYLVLKNCCGVIRSVWAVLCSCLFTEEFFLPAERSLAHLVKRRDILSSIMLTSFCHLGQISAASLPVESVVVAVRWLKKSLLMCSEFVGTSLLARHAGNFRQSAADLKRSLDKFDRALDMFWGYQNRLISRQSGRLWQLGGHAAVPYASCDWPTLLQLRNIISPIAVGALMKSFSDNASTGRGIAMVAENLVMLEYRILKKRSNFDVIRDWLGLYATYYWLKTRELEDFEMHQRRASSRGKLEMQELAIKFAELATLSWGNTDPSGLDNNELVDTNAAVYTGHQYPLIARENEACGENFMTVAAELHVIRSLYYISNQLSTLILQSGACFNQSYREDVDYDAIFTSCAAAMRTLNRTASRVIEVSIRFTLIDSIQLRELQSLTWALDSMLAEYERLKVPDQRKQKWNALENVARAYVVTLDTRLAAFLMKNTCNFLSAVDFSWMSPTLLSSLDLVQKSRKSKGGTNNNLRAVFNGPALLLRPIGLQAVLRMIDFRATATSSSAMKLVQEATSYAKAAGSDFDSNIAEIPVSTCANVRTRMQQLYRMYIHCQRRDRVEKQSTDTDVIFFEQVINEGRFVQLSMMTIDVIICFLDCFQSKELLLQLSDISCRVLGPLQTDIVQIVAKHLEFYSEVLTALLHQESSFVDETVSVSLFWTHSLKPLLAFLSGPCSDSWNEPTAVMAHFNSKVSPADIGEAWVHLGCLRAHFVLPDAPVDPATVSTVKASLLNKSSIRQVELIQSGHWGQCLAGNATVTGSAITLMDFVQVDRAKIELLLRSSIQRRKPEDLETSDGSNVVLFSDVYDILKNGLDNLVSLQKLSDLLQRSKYLHSILSKYDNILGVSKLPEKVKASAKEAVAGLEICIEEESNWQSSYAAFLSHVTDTCPEYEDVTSVVLSSLHNISFGLRLAISWRCSKKGSNVPEIAVANIVEKAVLSAVKYPFSSNLAVNARITCGIRQTSHQLLRNLNISLSAVDILVARTESLCGEKSKPVCVTALLLQLLSKIDYFVGCNLVEPSQVMRMFDTVLKKMLQFHTTSDNERKRRQAEKDSMFKHRVKENTFISNDAEEEMGDLRLNFPDHLAEFQGMLKASEHEEVATGDANGDSDVDSDFQNDVEIENNLDNASSVFDFTAVSTDVSSYHARMIFVHEQADLLSNGKCWMSSGSGKNGLGVQVLDIGASKELLDSYIQRTLTATKTLHGAIDTLVNPHLDIELNGTSLLIMSATADHCQFNRNIALPKTSYHLMLGDKVDRDLSYLLFQDSNLYRSPVSFHVDPCKEEILHAAAPLNNLLKKASGLLVEFPGNEMLLQLCKLTARISQFHISTPLGKMLASIELLYREAHHWESYAAKHVSIIEEINGLGSLIARWREKELKSWEDLLRCKEQEYVVKAIEFWFTMSAVFRSVLEGGVDTDIKGPDEEFILDEVEYLHIVDNDLDESEVGQSGTYSFSSWHALSVCSPEWLLASASKNRKMNANITENTGTESSFLETSPQQKLFESLDGFLKGAVVGEFPVRLHMVRLFALQLEQHCIRQSKLNKILVACAHVAMNMWKFYDQFLPAVRGFQDIMKSPIQKRIKDEIKISKWDQLSSYGLMEHSEKIHRKLNKIIREYQQDVLDYPVTSLLRKEAVGELAGENGDALQSGSLKEIPSLKVIFPFLSKLEPESLVVITSTDGKVDENDISDDNAPPAAKQRKLKVKRSKKARNADSSIVRSTSSALEGVHFGYCDVVVMDRVRAVVAASKHRSTFLSPSLVHLYNRYPRLGKVENLLPKVQKALKSLLLLNKEESDEISDDMDTSFGHRYINKCRFGCLSHELVEDICSDIFGQMAGLQGEDVVRNQKQRALRELFDALQERVGVSQLHIDIPDQFKVTAEMLTVPAPLSAEIAADLLWDFSMPRDHLESAETYFVKNISEINELRTQAACEFSNDITGREVHAMTGFAENMLMRCFQMRSSITAFLSDIKSVTNETNTLFSTLTAVYDYRAEYERLNAAPIPASIESEAIRKALAFRSMVNDAWKYRRVAGGVLANALLELDKLIEPAVMALEQKESIGSNSDITSVFADSHVPLDVAVNLSNNVSSMMDLLRASLRPSMGSSHLNQVTVLHASDVFGYRPAEKSQFGETETDCLSSIVDALFESEVSILKCLNKFTECKNDLCLLLPLEVVVPIFDQFESFTKIVNEQRSALNCLLPSSVCDESAVVDLTSCSNEKSNNLFEKVSASIQDSIDECLLAVQRLRYLSLSNKSSEESKKTIKSCFGERVVKIPVFCEDDNNLDIISGAELSAASASSLQLLNISKYVSSLTKLLHEGKSSNEGLNYDFVNVIHSAALLVSTISLSSRIILEDMVRLFKSFSKMTYICMRIFRNLMAKGFCTSNAETNIEDGEGQGDGTMQFQDDVDGTGMGDGDGKKDVSDEIENEEQLLGLKDEKNKQSEPPTEKKELDEKEKDTGVEMNQDFDGELYDIPDEDNDDEDKDDEEEDLDREMDHGAEFDYENVVDEQQWGSDDDDDEDNHGNREDNKEMFEEGNAMDSETVEGEMRTKDDDENEQNGGGNEDKPDDKDKIDDDLQNNEDNKGKVNDEDEADTMEKPQGVDVRKPDDSKQGEEDASSEEEGDGSDEKPQDLPNDVFNERMDTSEGPEGDIPDEPEEESADQCDIDNVKLDNYDDDASDKSEVDDIEEDGDQCEPALEDKNEPETSAVQDGGEQDQELDLKESNQKPKNKKSTSSSAFGVRASDGKDAMQKDDTNGDADDEQGDQQVSTGQASGQGSSASGQNDPQSMEDGAEKEPMPLQDPSEAPEDKKDSGGGGDNDASGASNTDAKSSAEGPPNNRHREPPNPFRKKGDLDKTWHERLNMKKQKQDQQGSGMDKTSNKDTGISAEASGVFEYEMNDGQNSDEDENYGGDQVLAETVEGDAMKLQNNAEGNDKDPLHKDTEGGADGNDEIGHEIKDKDNSALASENSSSKRERERDGNDAAGNSASDSDHDLESNEPDRKRKKTETHLNENRSVSEVNKQLQSADSDRGSDIDVDHDMTGFPDDDKSESAVDVDQPDALDFGGKVIAGKSLLGSAVAKTGNSEHDDDSMQESEEYLEMRETMLVPTTPAAALWAHHKSEGDEASMNLCEQLRLVLEPNLAARLKGDYRTGKRINMRRVISYVASGFRRDKIWLRRTKLAKRDYQVMIMLDDSCSMGAAGPLAMTSLAIISSALSRLEVGDLAVCSFSDHVNMLHPFGSPFNDDSGAGIAAALKFNASKTLLARSLDAIIPVFEAARQGQMASSSSSGAVVQLCFLISDARLDTDNRDRLNNVIRTMAEKHILVVLIILDQNEDSKDSIFNTKSIEFTEEGIITRSYLDNFPFPFYVAIQKLAALPDVLADSLKQWFEFVQYSLDSSNNSH